MLMRCLYSNEKSSCIQRRAREKSVEQQGCVSGVDSRCINTCSTV